MLAILAASGVLLWSLQSALQGELDLLAIQLRIRKLKAVRIIQAAHKSMRFRRLWRARERPDPTSIMGSTTAWDHAATRTRRNYYNDLRHWEYLVHM